jgi:hypothetical protein
MSRQYENTNFEDGPDYGYGADDGYYRGAPQGNATPVSLSRVHRKSG